MINFNKLKQKLIKDFKGKTNSLENQKSIIKETINFIKKEDKKDWKCACGCINRKDLINCMRCGFNSPEFMKIN
jgi:hypothetical protein